MLNGSRPSLKDLGFEFVASWMILGSKVGKFVLLDISMDGDLRFGAFGFKKKGLMH